MAATAPVIGRLRVRNRCVGGGLEPIALRLRLESLLGSVELRPVGFPEGAVLVVRSLQAPPLPPDPLAAPADWGERVRAAITAEWRRAARPARAAIAPDAASVFFLDRAELLASLTRDVLGRTVSGCWYWGRLLGGVTPLSKALASAWVAHAAFLPAALALLPVATAQTAVATLEPTDVLRVAAAVHDAFELPSPALEVLRAGDPPQPAPRPVSVLVRTDPPWRAQIGPMLVAAPRLAPAAEYVLGVALTLARAPSAVRTLAFATQAAAWLRGFSAEPTQGPDGGARRRFEARVVPPRPDGVDDGWPPDRAVAPPTTGHLIASAGLPAVDDPPEDGGPQAPRPAMSPVAPAALPGQPNAFAAAQALPPAGVGTQLGGVLYLVYLLGWLGLPASWGDGRLGEHLGGWGVVEALGRGLLGRGHDRYAGDPLWAVLAELDGRPEGQLLGAGLPLRTDIALPAAWLSLLEWRQTRWAAGQARVPVALPSSVSEAMSPGAAHWVTCVRGFVRALLLARLGSRGGLRRGLLLRNGRLAAGRTHVELHLSLDQVTLPVRRAGLDCDPGWIPDLARVVLFHYED